MKKQLLFFASALAMMLFVTWSCDNGNADPVIIDGPPVIESITITGGGVEGETFTAAVVVNDGVEGSTISSLATLTWTITGPVGANGTEYYLVAEGQFM